MKNISTLADDTRHFIEDQWRRLPVRVCAFGALALLSLVFAQIFDDFVPKKISAFVGGSSVDRLLDLISNAMLVVTTFSLSVMVTVYRSTSSQFTPRLHRLIVEEPVMQNTLATFIGAFVYSLVAIILRETGYIMDDRATLTFVVTVFVLCVVVYSLIRWTFHLQTFGSLMDAARHVERITTAEIKGRRDAPCFGARVLTGDDMIPDGAMAVRARSSGYIQKIWFDSLNDENHKRGIEVYTARNVGSYVLEHEVIAYVHSTGDATETGLERDHQTMIEAHIEIGDLRTYDQDPRFGLIVMGEIASKALSPGINDPGTAIDMIARLSNLMMQFRDENGREDEVVYDRIWVRPLCPKDVFQDAFESTARDGASVVEVQIRLQKALAVLTKHPNAAFAKAAAEFAAESHDRAMAHIDFEPDRARLERAAGKDPADG